MTIQEKLQQSAAMLPPRASELTGTPPNIWMTASDTEYGQSVAEVSTTETTYQLKKTFNIYRSGILRLKYQSKKSTGTDIRVDIRRYDGITETSLSETTVSETTYADKSVDILVYAGDTIRIYLKGVGGNTAYLKNLKICFTLNKSSLDCEITLN